MNNTVKIFFVLFLLSTLISCTNTTNLTDSDCYSSFKRETENMLNAEVAIWKEPVRSNNYYTINLNYDFEKHGEFPENLYDISKSISKKFVLKICSEENRIVKITVSNNLVSVKGMVEEMIYFDFIYEDTVCYIKE